MRPAKRTELLPHTTGNTIPPPIPDPVAEQNYELKECPGFNRDCSSEAPKYAATVY